MREMGFLPHKAALNGCFESLTVKNRLLGCAGARNQSILPRRAGDERSEPFRELIIKFRFFFKRPRNISLISILLYEDNYG